MSVIGQISHQRRCYFDIHIKGDIDTILVWCRSKNLLLLRNAYFISRK